MIQKLEELRHRFEEVGQLIVQPDIVQDMKKFMQLNKEYKDLEKIVLKYNLYRDALNHQQQAKEMLEKEKDAELRELAKEELDELAAKIEELEGALKEMLIPKDPNDDKNIILEIRGGTGGDEAALFAGDLFRMYQRFCDRRGLKLTVLDSTEGTAGGFKEIVSSVTGEGAYALFKFESGVHRVQRVPDTETMGRVHTSAASVAVLMKKSTFLLLLVLAACGGSLSDEQRKKMREASEQQTILKVTDAEITAESVPTISHNRPDESLLT